MLTGKLEAAKKLLNLGYPPLASIRSVIECGNPHDFNASLTHPLLLKESRECFLFCGRSLRMFWN
jgi:hypothetical protein